MLHEAFSGGLQRCGDSPMTHPPGTGSLERDAAHEERKKERKTKNGARLSDVVGIRPAHLGDSGGGHVVMNIQQFPLFLCCILGKLCEC